MPYQAEYIWIDGTKPSPLVRSKTKIVADGKQPGIWGFDGSSTNQATGSDSDCVLRPVFVGALLALLLRLLLTGPAMAPAVDECRSAKRPTHRRP